MENKIFGTKKIKIKEFSKKELRNASELQNFINSLLKENVQIFLNEKFSLKDEKKWIQKQLNEIKNNKKVFLIAKDINTIVK